MSYELHAPMSTVVRLACALLLVAGLGPPDAHAQASRTVSRTFDLPRDGSVVLNAYSGRVDVETWDRARVAVSATIEGEKQERVDKVQITFDRSGDELTIDTDYDQLIGGIEILGVRLFQSSTGDRPSTDYVLKLPRTAALNLDLYSAEAHVPRLAGALTFDAYSSPLDAGHLSGRLEVDTYSGDATVRRLDGELAADTYSGTVRVDSLAGTAQFDSYSGSATLTFATLAGDCAFDTYSGDATVTLPTGAGAVVLTEADALTTDLPVQLDRTDDRVRATIRGGGPELRFDTYSGTLTVRSAP